MDKKINNNQPVRLGIIGCGFAARRIHIPRLSQMKDRFKVVAVCDINETAAQQASDLLGGVRIYPDFTAMSDEMDLEAVAILTPLHAKFVEQALRMNLDVFVEKPFCETPEEAKQLSALSQKSQNIVMVGSMRLFDPAIKHLQDLVSELGPLRWVEVRDCCGQSLTVDASDDLVASNFQAGLPVPEGKSRNALQCLLLEFIHVISILRGVFGGPISCQEAGTMDDGWSLTGKLILPGNIPCIFGATEFGVVRAEIFDVSIRLIGEKGFAEVLFGDSNEKHGGKTQVNCSGKESVTLISDTFKLEWEVFYQAIKSRKLICNSANDGASDVFLAWEIWNSAIYGENQK